MLPFYVKFAIAGREAASCDLNQIVWAKGRGIPPRGTSREGGSRESRNRTSIGGPQPATWGTSTRELGDLNPRTANRELGDLNPRIGGPQPATPWCRGNFLLRNALKSGDTMVSRPTLPEMFKFEPRLCRNPGFPPPPRGRSRGCRGAVPLPLPPPSTRKAPHRPPHRTSRKLGQRLRHTR